MKFKKHLQILVCSSALTVSGTTFSMTEDNPDCGYEYTSLLAINALSSFKDMTTRALRKFSYENLFCCREVDFSSEMWKKGVKRLTDLIYKEHGKRRLYELLTCMRDDTSTRYYDRLVKYSNTDEGRLVHLLLLDSPIFDSLASRAVENPCTSTCETENTTQIQSDELIQKIQELQIKIDNENKRLYDLERHIKNRQEDIDNTSSAEYIALNTQIKNNIKQNIISINNRINIWKGKLDALLDELETRKECSALDSDEYESMNEDN